MKRTYQPSKIRRARTHGFLVRMKTRGGRAVINARIRRFAHFAEVVAVATEMRNFTKGQAGSSWAIDRRGPV